MYFFSRLTLIVVLIHERQPFVSFVAFAKKKVEYERKKWWRKTNLCGPNDGRWCYVAASKLFVGKNTWVWEEQNSFMDEQCYFALWRYCAIIQSSIESHFQMFEVRLPGFTEAFLAISRSAAAPRSCQPADRKIFFWNKNYRIFCTNQRQRPLQFVRKIHAELNRHCSFGEYGNVPAYNVMPKECEYFRTIRYLMSAISAVCC